MLIRASKISWIFVIFSISPQTNYWVAIHGIWWMQVLWNRMTGKSWTRSFRLLWMLAFMADIFSAIKREDGPFTILSFLLILMMRLSGYSWLIIFCRRCRHTGTGALWLRMCRDDLGEKLPFFHRRKGSSTGKILICSFCASCQLVLSSRYFSPV